MHVFQLGISTNLLPTGTRGTLAEMQPQPPVNPSSRSTENPLFWISSSAPTLKYKNISWLCSLAHTVLPTALQSLRVARSAVEGSRASTNCRVAPAAYAEEATSSLDTRQAPPPPPPPNPPSHSLPLQTYRWTPITRHLPSTWSEKRSCSWVPQEAVEERRTFIFVYRETSAL